MQKISLTCYGGQNELARISTRSLAVSAWLGHLKVLQAAETMSSFPPPSLRDLTLDLGLLCNAWGWRPDAVLRELRSLEWDSTGSTSNPMPRRTGVSVSVTGAQRAFWLWIHTPFSESQLTDRLDSELIYLRNRLEEVEKAGLRSLAQLQSAITLVAAKTVDEIDFSGDSVITYSERFHAQVEEHFRGSMDEVQHRCFTWPPPISSEQVITPRIPFDISYKERFRDR